MFARSAHLFTCMAGLLCRVVALSFAGAFPTFRCQAVGSGWTLASGLPFPPSARTATVGCTGALCGVGAKKGVLAHAALRRLLTAGSVGLTHCDASFVRSFVRSFVPFRFSPFGHPTVLFAWFCLFCSYACLSCLCVRYWFPVRVSKSLDDIRSGGGRSHAFARAGPCYRRRRLIRMCRPPSAGFVVCSSVCAFV